MRTPEIAEVMSELTLIVNRIDRLKERMADEYPGVAGEIADASKHMGAALLSLDNAKTRVNAFRPVIR